MQMMLNIMDVHDDRSAATQRRLQSLARELSGPTREGFKRQGASVRGWTAGLNQLDAGPYRLVGATTLEEALRLAASSIRETGKPVGLLVWGPSPKPREAISPAKLGRQFVPRRQGSWAGALPGAAGSTMSALAGKYVIVMPYIPIEFSRIGHIAA
jgi:hypothetical protein